MRITKCMCSQCKLYVRVLSEKGDQDYEALRELKQFCFEDRKYQTALIDYAKKCNIMGCLPTGSGKTFIALKLIEHFKAEVLTEGKKVFFLANTIPLVNQQAAFIARNSNFKVQFLTGDCDVDYWSKDKWDVVIQEFNVMAMTPQIFLNMLNHGHILFSEIALLIFDECHHAVGQHPMSNIMKLYKSIKGNSPNSILPRILGLTATIIKGTCKPEDVPKKVGELEETMDSVALTYKDYGDVLRHSTSAVLQPLMFTNTEYFGVSSSIIEQMESASESLQKFRQERKKTKMKTAKLMPSALDPSLTTFDNVYNLMAKKPSPGDLRIAVDDVLHAYRDLGPYCAMLAISLRKAFIEFSLMDINDSEVKSWYHKVNGLLDSLAEEIQRIMDTVDEKMRPTRFVSEKVKKLVEILEKYRQYEYQPICEFETNDKRLCGLVFTDRRTTAQVLSWYLKDLAANSKADHGFIKAEFVVGTSRSAFESIESRVYSRKQTETINKFRNKECNLLIATSVLEEGIDVPSCNVVVRFDPVGTYTSYIQSKGRARKKGANFFALIPLITYSKNTDNLKTFEHINCEIINYLKKNVEKIDEGTHQIPFTFEADLIPPICPGGTSESPRITMDSAADVVERYCNLLPSDGISTLQSWSWWTSISTKFQGTLKMPLNSVVKGITVGIPMSNKDLAKQAVYMAVAQKLLDAGAFDERLIPVHQKFPLSVEKFFTDMVPLFNDGNEAVADIEEGEILDDNNATVEVVPPAAKRLKTDSQISLIRKEWYKRREPAVLTKSPLALGGPRWVYRIKFNLSKQREQTPWKNLYQLKNIAYGLGLICSNAMPNIGSIPLFGAFGTMDCTLEEIHIDQSLIKLQELEDIQEKLFVELLGINNPLLKRNKNYGLMIAPLIKEREGWQIYAQIMGELKELHAVQETKPPIRHRDQSRSRN